MTETTEQTARPSPVMSSSELQALRDQVTVVVATLNEAEAIGRLVDEIKAAGYSKVLVVDGYSTDATRQIAAEHGAMVLGQHGKGKGAAVLTARDVVKTPYFLLMDGDYTYDPADIDRFVIHADGYDHIIGFRPKGCPNISRLHRLGNWILTAAFNTMMGSNVPDAACGMYLMRTGKVRQLIIDRAGFEVDQVIATQMLIDGKVTYVPISYRQRVGNAKASTWRQGFRALFAIINLGRQYNPIFLFSALASLALIPAILLLGYAVVLYFIFGQYHEGYFLGSVVLLVLGAQGFTVATVGAMLRRIERKLNSFHNP